MNESGENEILFIESQRFRQWWIWLLLIGINVIFWIGVFKQIIGGQPYGDKPMSDAGLLILTAVVLLFTAAFASLRLETLIRRDGIYIRFFPFSFKFRKYGWDILVKCFVRKYLPLGDYGGWGMRYGFPGKGKAYSVSGNKGLQLEFTDNKKLLIGTQKPEEITRVLKEIGRWRE